MNAGRTPRSVAIASSTWLAGLISLACLGLTFFFKIDLSWIWFAVFAGVIFLISYLTISYFIERFLYRKVKVIYKTIHSLQSQGENMKRIRMGEDILAQVNSEVADWAEEKIAEVKELRATDKFRKEFIGNLAHELKTPLFSLQGSLETLIDTDLSDPAVNRRFLDKANSACERLLALIKDLDQIALFESGSVPLHPERIDLLDLTRKSMDALESMAQEREVTLSLKGDGERTVWVEADRVKIEQVVNNLLVNSIIYGKEGGETTVRFYDMEDNILIEIADNGVGIAKQHLPRVFERFFRVDSSRSRNSGGSGLGLAICKHILESHHQTISVRSTEDVGSTFSFTLKKALS